LTRPLAAWPLLLAANRDEVLDRPWDPPAAHWPEQPGVVGGLDRLAGGTWLAVNSAGLIAGVLNRVGSLGPQAGKRSRGELPLLALRHATARDAVAALRGLDAADWRSFNLVIADRAGAWLLLGLGHGAVQAEPLAPGLHMITAHDADDPASPRVSRHLARLRAAPVPDPATGDWSGWLDVMRDRSGGAAAVNVPPRLGFGTASAALLALPAAGPPVWLFAPGPPDLAAFAPIDPPGA
jgi:uncharacterized protein with NRDE domain